MDGGVTSGIGVVEFGDSIAAAYCGKLLADYGASVTKVELPGGDALRNAGPFRDPVSHSEHGSLFEFLNTSKQSVTIDWRTADGRSLVHRLVKDCHVVVHPFDQHQRERLGFGSAEMPAELVEVAISACGLDGPYAGHEHTPLTMAALGGWMHAMGDPGLPPLYPGGPYISYLTGASAATGALIALTNRAATAQGQLVEVSEFETAVAMLPYDTLQFGYAGTQRERSGELYGDNPLAAVYPCKDGYVQFQVGFRPREFLEMVGGPEVASDPLFQTAEARSANRDALRTLILDWLQDRERWQLFEECGRRRLVFSAVPDVAEVLELVPHQERSFFGPREGGCYQGALFPGPAIRFGDGRWRSTPAPQLGAANTEVLTSHLHVDPGDLPGLRERRTV